MVAFAGVLGKKSYTENKKNDKKKLHKTDISNPVLLSPSTFRKHRTLLDVKKTWKSTEENLNGSQIIKNKYEKEKRKLFTKKFKEIKKKKKNVVFVNPSKFSNKDKSCRTENIYTELNIRNKNFAATENDVTNLNNCKESIKHDINVIGNTNTIDKEALQHDDNDALEHTENKNTIEDDYVSIKSIKSQISEELCRRNPNTEKDLTLCSENKIPVPSIDVALEIVERERLIKQYILERKELDELIVRLIECNITIAEKEDELRNYKEGAHTQSTFIEYQRPRDEFEEQEEDEEYSSIMAELECAQRLLRSVTELNSKQRKKISKNIVILDKIDIDLKTKKALFVNLKRGEMSNNSRSAPRSLLKYAKERQKIIDAKTFV